MVLNIDEKAERKHDLLEKCFELFVKQGLEKTSINDLASYCNTYKSALYTFFESKDKIVLESAKMYMTKLNEVFFKEFITPRKTIAETLRLCFEVVDKEREKLRYIYQVISSPTYGEKARKELSNIYESYIDYSSKLAQMYNIDFLYFKPWFLLYIAMIHDYCLWEDNESTKEKLDFVCKQVSEL